MEGEHGYGPSLDIFEQIILTFALTAVRLIPGLKVPIETTILYREPGSELQHNNWYLLYDSKGTICGF